MAGRFLKFFSPFVRITPEIKQPDREIAFKEKIIYTFVVLIIYIIMSNVPLYGVPLNEGTDYFYWLRVILAQQRGTLTELGIGPIVTAGLIMQLLQGSKIIKINMADPSDRALFTGAQKVMAMIITIVQSLAYIYGGAFGQLWDGSSGLKTLDIIFIFLQLLFATQIIILLDEILQKKWGIGSGVSLFIAAGVAGQIFWNAFSWIEGQEVDRLPRGIIIAFFKLIASGGSNQYKVGEVTKTEYWYDLFIRPGNSPGLLGLIMTIIIFLLVIYVETMRVEIPLQYAGYKGYRGKYPMKLLYVSNIPVILAQAVYANILFIGQLIAGPDAAFRLEHQNLAFLLDLIGKFVKQEGANAYLKPTWGLAYFLTAPQGISDLFNGTTPFGDTMIHAVVYLAIFLFLCIVLGRMWIQVSGLAPRDIAAQIIDSKMQIPGFRRSEKVIEHILKRYIPTLTILCGLIVGLLSFTADFLGALSSGTGLLLSVGIIQNYAEEISKQLASENYPGLRNMMGSK